MAGHACAELLTRINARVGLGHFGMDFDDGELGYRTTIPLSAKGKLQPDVIEHVMDGHQVIVDGFIPAITAVLFAGLSPEKALAMDQAQAGVASDPRFSLN